MERRAERDLTLPFEILAWTLLALTAAGMGIFALFFGGLTGLGVFLLAVVGVCVWSWLAAKRGDREVEEAAANAPPAEPTPEAPETSAEERESAGPVDVGVGYWDVDR